MSILSDFFSLEGLITVSVSSILTVKTFKINFNTSQNNVSVSGNNNNVLVVYNQSMKEFQQQFTFLWPILLFLIFFSYPLGANFYNRLLSSLVMTGIPISFFLMISMLKSYGKHAAWDFIYFIGFLFSCNLVFALNPFLDFLTRQAGQFYPYAKYLYVAFTGERINLLSLLDAMRNFMQIVLLVLGFSSLFLSMFYLLFSYIKRRSFDGAIRNTLTYCGLSVVGYLMCSGFFYALSVNNTDYLKVVIKSGIQLFI
ncbi:hypothetical protein [Pseudogulbenkiania ferrooxidans]|uniref:hypothetical protein n=1 Tax=Pseudogulbenkiania ferrooxidans TaxID=549169 RepID=UPI001267D930|nr:hypothetical protein [Pseudogulbenkiania ferrooxidans]